MPKAKATKKAMPDISKLTIPKLKALCKEMLIPCPGNKPEIIRAILDARAKKVTSPIKIASPKPSPKKVGSSPKNYEKMTLLIESILLDLDINKPILFENRKIMLHVFNNAMNILII